MHVCCVFAHTKRETGEAGGWGGGGGGGVVKGGKGGEGGAGRGKGGEGGKGGQIMTHRAETCHSAAARQHHAQDITNRREVKL